MDQIVLPRAGAVAPDEACALPRTGLQRVEEVVSEGSVGHGFTNSDGWPLCSPCQWYHSAAGCLRGDICRHCHLCPQGEQRRRKKIYAEYRRRRDARDRAASKDGLRLSAPPISARLHAGELLWSPWLHTWPSMYIHGYRDGQCYDDCHDACIDEELSMRPGPGATNVFDTLNV